MGNGGVEGTNSFCLRPVRQHVTDAFPMTTLTPQQVVSFLAKLMSESRRGLPSRVVLFLGAGASRAAGVPLADELKSLVASDVFGEQVPDIVKRGRLEDVMQLFQRLGGRDGYALIANQLRAFTSPSMGYGLLLDLVRRAYVEAVLTTNMDQLLEQAAAVRGFPVISIASETDFDSGGVSSGELMIAHLHGVCSDPATMKGSWTDTKSGLSKAKIATLENLISRYVMVFVGYAALDADIVPVLKATASKGTRIFWVDPQPAPSSNIADVLAAYSSEENYISLTAEEFFRDLHDAVFPRHAEGRPDVAPLLRQIASATEAPRLARERHYAFNDAFSALENTCTVYFGSLAAAVTHTGMRTSTGRGSVDFSGAHLGEFQSLLLEYLPQPQGTERTLDGPFLEISTGGPNLIVGSHLRRPRDFGTVRVVAYVLYIASWVPGTPKPQWPREVWACEQTEVVPFDDADTKCLESWLNTQVGAMYHKGMERLLSRLVTPDAS